MLYYIEFAKTSIFANYKNHHMTKRSYSRVEEGDWLLSELYGLKVGDLVYMDDFVNMQWNKFE